MSILTNPYGGNPFSCEGRVYNQFHQMYLERFFWERFRIHPCDQEDMYKTALRSVLVVLLLICLLFFRRIYDAACRRINSIITATSEIFRPQLVLLFEGLLNTPALSMVVLIWLLIQVPLLFMARFNAHWARWMPPTPESPSTAAREPTPETKSTTPATPPSITGLPGSFPSPTPPRKAGSPPPATDTTSSSKQGKTMRDIVNSKQFSTRTYIYKPLPRFYQMKRDREHSQSVLFTEAEARKRISTDESARDLRVEMREMTTSLRELVGLVMGQKAAVPQSIKTEVESILDPKLAAFTQDLDAKLIAFAKIQDNKQAAALSKASKSSSNLTSREARPKSKGQKEEFAKLEAKVKSLKEGLAKEQNTTARLQQELTDSHQALEAKEGELSGVLESLAHKETVLEAYQNELKSTLALKDAEIFALKESAMKTEQALEGIQSALSKKTADLQAANKFIDTIQANAARNAGYEKEASDASKTALEKELLENQHKQLSLVESIRVLEEANESLRKHFEESLASIQESNTTTNDNNARVQHLENALQLSEQKVADHERHINALMAEGQALQKEKEDMNEKGHALEQKLFATAQREQQLNGVCQEQAQHISKLQQESNGLRRQSEGYATQISDVKRQLKATQEAGAQAAGVAVRERDAKIAELEAKLETTQRSRPATPTTPVSKAQHSALFSPGPRRLPLSPITQESKNLELIAKLQTQVQALEESRDTLKAQCESVTKERDVLIQEQEDHQMEVDLYVEGANRDSSEVQSLEADKAKLEAGNAQLQVEKAEVERMKEELQRRLDNSQLLIGAQKTVLSNYQSNNASNHGTKRIASDSLYRDDQQKAHKNRRLEFFEAAFPHGYNRIPTSAAGLLCGLRALVSSVRAQHPNIEPVTFEQLYEMLSDTDYRTLAMHFGRPSRNNFRADELGLLIHLFYELYDLNVHVGIVQPGQEPMLIPGENSDRPDRLTVWIYNDRAREVARENGTDPDMPGRVIYNHYEGLERASESDAALPDYVSSDDDAAPAPSSNQSGLRVIKKIRAPTASGSGHDGAPRPRMQNNPFANMLNPAPVQTNDPESEVSEEE